MTAEGANVLPARVIEDAFQNQYDQTLNYSDFKVAIQKLDSWYADRGIFGQVGCCLTSLLNITDIYAFPFAVQVLPLQTSSL